MCQNLFIIVTVINTSVLPPDHLNRDPLAPAGGAVFTHPDGYFVGLLLSSNVPYKLASDKAFFTTWRPDEVPDGDSDSKARLVAGMLGQLPRICFNDCHQ